MIHKIICDICLCDNGFLMDSHWGLKFTW